MKEAHSPKLTKKNHDRPNEMIPTMPATVDDEDT